MPKSYPRLSVNSFIKLSTCIISPVYGIVMYTGIVAMLKIIRSVYLVLTIRPIIVIVITAILCEE